MRGTQQVIGICSLTIPDGTTDIDIPIEFPKAMQVATCSGSDVMMKHFDVRVLNFPALRERKQAVVLNVLEEALHLPEFELLKRH